MLKASKRWLGRIEPQTLDQNFCDHINWATLRDIIIIIINVIIINTIIFIITLELLLLWSLCLLKILTKLLMNEIVKLLINEVINRCCFKYDSELQYYHVNLT